MKPFTDAYYDFFSEEKQKSYVCAFVKGMCVSNVLVSTKPWFGWMLLCVGGQWSFYSTNTSNWKCVLVSDAINTCRYIKLCYFF